MTLSPEVAAWLRGLLDNVQISVGAPDFAENAAIAAQAKAELDAVLAQS